MPSERFISISKAIADELKSQGQPASFMFRPPIELKNLVFRICVIPKDEQIEIETRTSNRISSHVVIGVQRKASKVDAETEKLIELVRNIGRKYLRRRICESCCTTATNQPIYDAEELSDTDMFTGVVELTFIGRETA